MTATNTNRIEKRVDLAAPVVRVWRALSDHREFGQWFRVNLESPFVAGKQTRGHITFPGYEHLVMAVTVTEVTPLRRLSFTWHPYAIDPRVDYSKEPPTLVEFVLTPSAKGTLLVVTESGFDALPAHRRDEAFRMNDRGWDAQLGNIAAHVATPSA